MKKFLFVLLPLPLAMVLPLLAQDPKGFNMWTDSELKSIAKSIKLDETKAGNNRMANYGNHGVMEIRREGDGLVEIHQTQVDVMMITSGTADLVVGGTMVDGKTTAPGELRGKSINGGVTKKLAPGDVIHIPAGIPHQVLTHGKTFTYLVVKVDSK